MKTKYILHGGFTRKEDELNYSFFREFAVDIPQDGNILMCFFASGEEDKTDVFFELKNKFTKYSENKNFDFTLANKEEFIEQVKKADGIYFHGGKTRTLLASLKVYKNLELHFNHKTIAGSSAGAYVLALYGTAHDEVSIRKGLGVIDIRLVCHYQSAELPPTEASLLEIRNIAPEFELVFLKDCEWKVFLK
jgi:peptidase E